jgi:hypothetical protein
VPGGRVQGVVVVANSGGWERRLFSLSGANRLCLCPVGPAHNSPGEAHQSSNSVGLQDKGNRRMIGIHRSWSLPTGLVHVSSVRFPSLSKSRHCITAILAVGPARVASKVDRLLPWAAVALAKAPKTMAIIAEGADIRRRIRVRLPTR